MSTHALAAKVGDFVRVEGRVGWWPVWSTLSNEGRVMVEDTPGAAVGPCVVLEVRKATNRTDNHLFLRDVLDEIANNAENLLAGGLPHFTRRDFADAVAHRARAALRISEEGGR